MQLREWAGRGHAVMVWGLVAILCAGAPGASRPTPEDAEFWDKYLPPGGFEVPTPKLPPAFRWEVKDVISSVEVPGVVESDGIPVKMQQVIVRGKVADVLRGFLAQFKSQGLYIQPLAEQQKLSAHQQLTGLDPARFISYSVLAQQLDQDRCQLILGEANIAARAPQSAAAEVAPLFPGATGMVRSRGEGLRSLVYQAPGAEAEVRKFYSEVLGKAGYREESVGLFTRPGELIRVRTRTSGGKTQVLVTSQPNSGSPLAP